MIQKVARQQLDALNEIKNYYNTSIKITLTEKLQEGAESPCIGYKFRFAPLDDTVDAESWTGTWNGQPIQSSATLLGFMMAGYPHTVEFFPPDADIETAEPKFVVPFVISTPEINIEFTGGLTVDDLVGTYTGTVSPTEGSRAAIFAIVFSGARWIILPLRELPYDRQIVTAFYPCLYAAVICFAGFFLVKHAAARKQK